MSNLLIPIPEIGDLSPEIRPLLEALSQDVRVLTKQDGIDKSEAAILYGDVRVADAAEAQSSDVSGAVTDTEFNKLRADMLELRTRYNYLVALLRGETVGQ
jgi:hypothetical protein